MPRSIVDEVMKTAFDKSKGLLGGDDDSLTRCRQIQDRCPILDHEQGVFLHKRPIGDDCLLVWC